MNTLDWRHGILPVLDFETTGVDTWTDRAVSCALLFTTPKGHVLHSSFRTIIDPGIEIPAEAAEIHGITTERARADGIPAKEAFAEILRRLHGLSRLDLPLLIYNAPFDWPLLHAELSRQGYREPPPLPLIDPLVFDRHFNRYRKGGKRLENACAYYGVELTEAHAAHGDALATAELFRAMVAAHRELQEWTLEQYEAEQRAMHAEWVASMNEFFAKKGRTDRIENVPWPGVLVAA